MNEIFGAYISAIGKASLDAVNERILYTLAAKWYKNEFPTVLEAMVILPEISKTTAHRRLKQLRADDWISLVNYGKDGRIKYIAPTMQAQAYFAKLGAAIQSAVGGAA